MEANGGNHGQVRAHLCSVRQCESIVAHLDHALLANYLSARMVWVDCARWQCCGLGRLWS